MAPNEGYIDRQPCSSAFVVLPDTFDAPNETVDDGAIYRFWKVEEFFAGFDQVETDVDQIKKSAVVREDGMYACRNAVSAGIKAVTVAVDDELTLEVTLSDDSLLLIEAIRFDTVRIRWGPQKTSFKDYSQNLSRSLVMDTLAELRQQICKDENYSLTARLMRADQAFDWSILRDEVEHMRVSIRYAQGSIEIWRNVKPTAKPDESEPEKTQWSLVWSTIDNSNPNQSAFLSRKDPEGNFATCLSTAKRGKYIGFGEQGGLTLLKDGEMLNVYNYDNFAYSSVYGQQAINPSEPLYHADPFGVEVGGLPGFQSAVGLFIDDYSQTLLDLGAVDPSTTRLGSRFGDLEVHVTCADGLLSVCKAHSSCIGRPKLFPRWVLGFHQGCYGYDSADKLLACVQSYRQHGIPLDGLHVDVDLQHSYRTFTVDKERFGDARSLFSKLNSQGIKCSTNITPVISTQDDKGRQVWEAGNDARAQYSTLDSGLRQDVFVKNKRWNEQHTRPLYTYWEGGLEHQSEAAEDVSGQCRQYRGGVSYGEGLSTLGYYPDFGRKSVRIWWGQQYKELFDAGLAMVWQDMTTPAIMVGRGDMKTFPFRLQLCDDSESGRMQAKIVMTPALKITNLYSYNLHKATYQGVRRLSSRKGMRNFIIGRGSSTGHHRFAGLWTGDNTSSYDFLAISIQQVMSCGIGGTIITGADVGGFESFPFGSQWCDPELLCRWTMANTLLPWFRNHYNAKPGHKLFQEPFAFAENAWRVPEQRTLYEAVLPICRYYITLRYTLMQLLYDAMFASLFDGQAIVRPMLATDAWDDSLLGDKSSFLARQYMISEDVLVAPVLSQYSPDEGHEVYLPSGSSFYAFNLHLESSDDGLASSFVLGSDWQPLKSPVAGGTVIRYQTDVDRYVNGEHGHLPYLLPIYVREGAIIPTQNAESYVHQLRPNTITVHFYPFHSRLGKRTTYDMYIDDGVSLASAPSHLPQFALDKLNSSASDYRHVQFVHRQETNDEDGTTSRIVEIELKHKRFDVLRTRSYIGTKITLCVWRNVNVIQDGPLSVTRSDGGSCEITSRHDDCLNATFLDIPVDDVIKTTVRLDFFTQ